MKPSRKLSFFSSSSTTVTYTYHNDQIPTQQPISTQIPIQSSPSSDTPIPITVRLPPQSQSKAAMKIQSAYRSHMIRTLYKKIAAVNSEANQLERLIQRQDTVDAIRSKEKEKLRMNEALMGLLLKLDSVPGFDLTVREARRKVSRRIVGLQEILDAITQAKVENDDWWGYGLTKNWDDIVAEMEENICRERGGEEMEKFCAQHLGFRCLQRFLREP
ncbi:BAG family molecular chaperone regulator 5, mitochondrial-like [Quillaja saponaria]|uniref:BAG family molecular chaperone regulator 5, mitochondrial-like n=1 Tax=Quillaja saponaria TaxID=32244 RepID=A0AAD7M0M8_QUISA|nr:BAG family molecular chaperone regulator 5, mitochondrial-like [Quillaja saponaria]KAJ7967778.1 BAG family molecular chaperone regulator 5, mitochondrial-like [Quillaja saponaria]